MVLTNFITLLHLATVFTVENGGEKTGSPATVKVVGAGWPAARLNGRSSCSAAGGSPSASRCVW